MTNTSPGIRCGCIPLGIDGLPAWIPGVSTLHHGAHHHHPIWPANASFGLFTLPGS